MGYDERGSGARADAPEEPRITAEAVREMFIRALAELGRVESDAEPPARAAPKPPEITADAISDMLARAEGTDPEPSPAAAVSSSAVPSTDDVDTTTTAREEQCPSCYGSGTETCASCLGLGYHTTEYTTTDWEGNVEYVTEQYPCGCSGGQLSCGGCGGRGVVLR